MENNNEKSKPSDSEVSKKWVLGDKTVPKNWKTCREFVSVGGKRKKKISFLSDPVSYHVEQALELLSTAQESQSYIFVISQ